MREKHSALVLNIGTYAKEDEVHELLNSLSVHLPFVIMITSVLDVLLAGIYLKGFHPWKIILQEVWIFKSPFSSFITFSRNQTHGRWRKMRRREWTRERKM